jgi:hypothetical protein
VYQGSKKLKRTMQPARSSGRSSPVKTRVEKFDLLTFTTDQIPSDETKHSVRRKIKQYALREEAKQLAFSNETQLLGVGMRRLSMGSGGLRRNSSNTPLVPQPLLTPPSASRTLIDLDFDMGDDVIRTDSNRVRGQDCIRTMNFRDQTSSDLHLLMGGEQSKIEIEPPSTQYQKQKTAKLLLSNHQALTRAGLDKANAKFVEKQQQGRLQIIVKGKKQQSPASPIRRLIRRIAPTQNGRTGVLGPLSTQTPVIRLGGGN